jgi:hypothetical protein
VPRFVSSWHVFATFTALLGFSVFREASLQIFRRELPSVAGVAGKNALGEIKRDAGWTWSNSNAAILSSGPYHPSKRTD